MGLFGPSREERVKERSSFVRNLAKQFNSKYYYGIKNIKNSFYIENDSDMDDSNIIVGEVEDYDYCFVEYYHVKSGKNDSSRWVSKVLLKAKEGNYPDFELVTKRSAKLQAGCLLGIGAFIGLPTITQSIVFLTMFLAGFKNSFSILEALGFLIIGLAFLSIFIGISYWLVKTGLNKMKKIKNNDNYNIRNREFKEKYVILTDSSPKEISKVFNEEVCNNIMKLPSELTIAFNKNTVSKEFNNNEQLSVNLCNQHLNDLLDKVRLFKTESTTDLL